MRSANALNTVWMWKCRSELRSFRQATHAVAQTQFAVLQKIVSRNQATEFGVRYGFGGIRSPKEFQERVPLADYGCYEDSIQRIAAGEQNVLTRERVRLLEPTSGSTCGEKLIPYTRSLRAEFRRAVSPWIADLMQHRHEGTPQDGPLSPLLANVLLDEVDKELERRGHCFVRYADDCNVYVRSRRAGERVRAALRQQYAKLRLQINEEKSAVARVWDRTFLGYSFWVAKGRVVKLRVAARALEEMKQRVRSITIRNGGRSMTRVTRDLGAYLRGWNEYFKLADTPGIFAGLDGWIHRRLRAVQLKQWKRSRATLRELRARGLPEWLAQKGAGHGGRWWYAAALGAMHTALPGLYFERLGVPRLAAQTSTH